MTPDLSIEDAIDQAQRRWQETAPDLDVSAGDVVHRIERLGHLLEEAQNDQLRRRGGRQIANRGDFDVLRALRSAGPPYALTPTELHAAVLVSSAGLSGKLNRLEMEGWIHRERTEVDGRSRLVRLTDEGRDELDAYLEPHLDFERSLLDPLDPEQRSALADSLRQLIRHLEASRT